MKKNIEKHYISKDKKTNIYIKFYTTKSGFLKFHVQIFKEMDYNNNGFCSCVSDYKTKENSLLNYLKYSNDFQLVG